VPCSVCELHAHDEWSLLDGVASALDGAKRAAECGHVALAKTNHGSLSGTIHHMEACHEVGIMPIVGVEAYYRPKRITNVEVKRRRDRGIDVSEYHEYYHMILLARNLKGWKSLMRLTSEAYRSGFYRYPCVDDELLDKWNEGLIISTTCIKGFIPQAILRGDWDAVQDHARKLKRWAGEYWYVELQPHDFDDQRAVNLLLPNIAQSNGQPIVAAKDAHFPRPEDAKTQKISVMIRTRDSFAKQQKKQAEIGDDFYDLSAPETCYIGTAEDTAGLFRKFHPNLEPSIVDQAIANTGEVANWITPFLLDRSPKVPRFMSSADESYRKLKELVYQGIKDKGHGDEPEYFKQADHELKILRNKDFCDFFLITWDFVKWARSTDPLPPLKDDNGKLLPPEEDSFFRYTALGGGRSRPCLISVRGSAGGSVVSYALRIIAINPITWGLRFERFLNPDRDGLPDIDLDFSKQDADLVKEYIKRHHGRDKVYDMIAHGTMQAKAAIKRVAIVYDIDHAEINQLTKSIDKGDNDEDIADLRQSIKDLDRFFDRHPEVYEHASKLQRSIGTISEHAAGVVLSNRPLDELMPVMKKSAADDYLVTAFGEASDTQIVSSLGFLKLDLLVVIELAKLAYAIDLIGKNYDVEYDVDAIPGFEDPYNVDVKTMELFQRGLLMGVFQYGGSAGITALTKRLAPENHLHLCAINAIYRPATLATGVADEFVDRRHNPDLIEYWDPSVEPFLRETNGMMIYQEQVMDVLVALGGFSPARADSVRKIMSKWYRAKGDIAEQKLGTHREDFISQAASVMSGGRTAAENVWHFMGGFSDYSFNKSHAAQYELLGYADANIKARYPDCFYASLLTFPPSKIKKPEERKPFYAKTIREAKLLGVDVLPPDVNESMHGFTVTKDGLRFGLGSISGLGPASVDDIIQGRPFGSLGEVIEWTSRKGAKCNAGGRKHLGAAGALDRFGARDDLTEDERQEGEERKLGVVLSKHDTIGPMRDGLARLIHTQAEFEELPHGSPVVIGGEIIGGKEVSTRKGPSLKLDVAFGSDEYKASWAPWDYGDHVREVIDKDEPVVIRGAKDSAYDCVQVDKIELAKDVLELMGEPAHV
jgi:DNA polymerase-3 subunit alpha